MAINMRNIVRGVSHLVTVGGVVVFARSAIHPNPVLEKEGADKAAIVFDAREKYHVGTQCYSGFGGVVCEDTVLRPVTQEEQKKILAQYKEEVALRQSQVPVDQEAHRQAQRDGLGMLTGLSMIGVGTTAADMELRKGKQFENRMERQGGRRKEF